MIFESALSGIVAALVVFFTRSIYDQAPGMDWSSPAFILGIGAIAMIFYKFLVGSQSEGTTYGGVTEFLVHIHAPFKKDVSKRWLFHACVSFLLSVFGGAAGPEGAASELIQAIKMKLHSRSTRWFEQKRRTHVASSLAAGISAAFGAPFSGILLPLELGVGGTSLSTITSSLSAFIAVRFLLDYNSMSPLDVSGVLSGFHFSILREWTGTVIIGVVCGFAGLVTIRFLQYTQEGLSSLFRSHIWMRVMAGAVLLSLVFFVYKPIQNGSSNLVEELLWIKYSRSDVALYFFAQVITLALVLAGFGTAGIFWPLFTLGGFLGFSVNHWMLNGLTDFSAAASLTGSAAFWGVLLDAPLTGAVLAFEMTQNFYILLPCLIAGFIAQGLRKLLKTPSLIGMELEIRGVSLTGGRSQNVLKTVSVKDAMVTDYEVVFEHETVRDLQVRILKARYPFLPVVNQKDEFQGLLTVDLIQEAWRFEGDHEANESLAKLIEAKDLLYKSGYRSPTVQLKDKLSDIVDVFDELPCVPVLGEGNKVVGLLFSHHVRLAYDRQLAMGTIASLDAP